MLPLLGIVLLAILFVDVFLTVFHARGHGGPLNRAQNRAIWSGFALLSAR